MDSPAAPQEHFANLDGASFLVLTTYRASGAAAPTTVWFAEATGKVYITTIEAAGKVKRLRANPHVLVAPSDQVGTPLGPAVAAQGRVLPPAEAAPAEAALRDKYGAQYDAVLAQMRSNGPRVFIELAPEGQTQRPVS